jgi:hypothetical protein
MKLLLDQGLPLSAAALLSDAGIDTIHVGEIGMLKPKMQKLSREQEKMDVLLLHSMQISIHFWRLMKQLHPQSFAFVLKGYVPKH